MHALICGKKIPKRKSQETFLTCIFGILYVMYQKKKYNWIPRTREKIKINHSGFHGDAAHLDILNLISVGAQNGSCAFRVLVRTLTFSFWNQFLIGSEIINVIIGLDNCQINARTWAHVIDNTSCNGVTNLKMNKNNNLRYSSIFREVCNFWTVQQKTKMSATTT